MSDGFFALVAVLIVAAIIVAPLAIIWALNTLFLVGIPYTWKTWAATLILGGAIKGGK